MQVCEYSVIWIKLIFLIECTHFRDVYII
jgi:hypothetical protein